METILGLVVCFISISSGYKWPLPGIELCHRNHPDFYDCLKKNIPIGSRVLKDGFKEIGFPRIEPLKLPSPITLKMNGNKNMEMTVTLINSYFSESSIGVTIPNLDVHIGDEDDHCGWLLEMLIPRTVLYGDYSMIGKLMLFQINGHGKFNVTMHNYKNHYIAQCEKIQKKGKTYLKLTNYTTEMYPENLDLYFENLIPGNPEMSAQVLNALNDVSILIWEEVKSGITAIVSKVHLEIQNKFFMNIPRDEIFLP